MSKAVSTSQNIYLDSEVEGDLQDRLSRIEGHVRGIKRMLSEHASCEDLLLQLSAVRSALNQATGLLLENHMETCVANCVRAGQGEKALSKLKGALAHVVKNL
jgi:CsoR family transcriptional regulator, copper-sensing transcriptional repressor